MTRVDLQLLIIEAIKDVNRYDFGTQSILLTKALWPVLANVWDDGNDAGFAFGNGQPEETPNPYR